MNWPAALLLALLTAGDPRLPLIELQIAQDHAAMLAVVDAMTAEDPQKAGELGLDYLRGTLLLKLDRSEEALDAFVDALSRSPQLEAYSRFRLAVEQERLGNPEIAAGLIARLVSKNAPRALQPEAVELLVRTLEKGGDCRLLRSTDPSRFERAQRRLLQLAQARCALRDKKTQDATQVLLKLLDENREDDVARLAAHLLRDSNLQLPPKANLWIGLSLHSHREFDLAIEHLAEFITLVPTKELSEREIFESRYSLARSHFWESRFRQAAKQFGDLARLTSEHSRRAQALYQQARCYELLGSWDQASAVFQRVYQAEPRGRWADAAILSYMRLQWRLGHEQVALQALEALVADRHFATASRAWIFLASSEIVQGRGERAKGWLQQASLHGKIERYWISYWRARMHELEGNSKAAAQEYLNTLRPDPYHPLAKSAQNRLAALRSFPQVQRLAQQLASSPRLDDLYKAWILLGDSSSISRGAHKKLAQLLATRPTSSTFLALTSKPVEEWQLWRAQLDDPEEQLLALGLFREGASALARHFPLSRPRLAFTGSLMLAQAGEYHRSLYLAEVLHKRKPNELPPQLLPISFRRLLYPVGYRSVLLAEAERQRIDPYLLSAIIREESRFKPRAFSGAAARGLTQFIFPTARRVSLKIGQEVTDPRQIEQPEVAIALGAAYLRELQERFDGSIVQSIAAYNAGEPQSDLWKRYCFSDEPEEFISKVGFKETRNYLRKVLTSYNHYLDLYGATHPQP